MEVRKKVGESIIELIRGDITSQETDAIVNAANSRLAPGGGVAGAIHRAAGPELWEECKKLGGCETGEAKITKGYNLKATHIIHTVGPIYSGTKEDEKLLASCYRNSLKLAVKNEIKTISFPSISTGAFGYPMKEAARIAFQTIIGFLNINREIRLVRLVLYGEKAFEIHKEVLDRLLE